MSQTTTTGTVYGTTVPLDAAVPPLDGQRVRVVLEPLHADVRLPPDEQAEAWQCWVQAGPQGPREVDVDDDVREW